MAAVKTLNPSTDSPPLTFWPSVAYFGIPALVFIVGFHGVMRALLGVMPAFYAYLIGVGGSLTLMLIVSFLFTEGTLKERFRLRPMSGKSWLLAAGGVVGAFVLSGLLVPVTTGLITAGLMPVPGWLPGFLQPAALQPADASLMGLYDSAFGGLRGNWLAFAAFLLLVAVNILGEEFWWRGVVLPRQEAAFGAWAWLPHGVMWCLFHAFKWWDLIFLLPITLLISYVAQRTQNTWPSIVMHLAFNSLPIVPLFLMVAGLV